MRTVRLGVLGLVALLAGSLALAASAEAAPQPVLLDSSHPLVEHAVHAKREHKPSTDLPQHRPSTDQHRRSTDLGHRDAVRKPPNLRRDGTTLVWSPLHGIKTYVLLEVVVRGKKHHHTSVAIVKGTRVHPRAHAGQTVEYRLRARIAGSEWSHNVLIRYAAVKPKPSTSGSTGSAGPPPPPAATPVSSDPIVGHTLYVDPDSDAAAAEQQAAAAGQSANAALLAKIASQPSAKWFGDWSYGHGGTQGDVNWWASTATAAGAEPVIVAYDLPWLDCGGYSAGGASSPAAYESFIDQMVAGLAGRRAVVIVEPDALAEVSCLSASEQASYYQLLNYAVDNLTTDPLAAVYLDSGNATWQSAATMASRLQQAGIAKARGFSLNVSNFGTTSSEIAYGTAINAALGGNSHFVIDTSRNGQGPAPGNAWCNPPGRGLGTPPTANTGNPLVDAYLWIKDAGESDGTCNGGPSAGTFWTSYALGLASNAVF
jgi:endoglucanase